MRLVKANATHIRSQMGWRTITALLPITARHPKASEAGRWSRATKEAAGEEAATKVSLDIGEMWLRLVQGPRKVCVESVDQREDIRTHALLSLQRCLMGVDDLCLPHDLWLQCFDLAIFTMLDDLLEIVQGHSPKDYPDCLQQAMAGGAKRLSRMEKYMKAKVRGKNSEKLQELVPKLLKNTLFVMRTRGVLTQRGALGGEVCGN
ncbi:Arf guanine-nucleotide exchange factor gnom [Thalictrum thalictroides]|uniref:Arf guanine-nucleotide exchange factor gnom n=1 Tax=Thalictrum thalictroides TaxID=46969 RepID=A0A7J6VFZ8_THATH|nr:Arf guanine-nucleotide exchange factor gnom [Thalictrum thalictroides]